MSVKAKSKAKAPARTGRGTKAAPARKTKPTAKAPKKVAKTKDVELRTILEELRKRTLAEIREKLRSGAGAVKEIGDMYDHATEDRDRELDLLLGGRERGKLLQIEEAFARLSEGTYGECEECGEPINAKRLRIVPFARTCVDCQQDKENEDRLQREVENERLYPVMTSDAPTGIEDDD